MWIVALNLDRFEALRIEPVASAPDAVLVDEQLELARRYAPWIHQRLQPPRGRMDVPTRADFDGNLRGDDNWERFTTWEQPPTVYYAVLETRTHWFLTYHLFHARDWSALRLGLHLTHENDGENLQVVVDKATGAIVLLFTQAHYRGAAHVAKGSPIRSDVVPVTETLWLAEDDRPGVFVEQGGHGIYGMEKPDGTLRYEYGTRKLTFRPAEPGEAVAEPSAFLLRGGTREAVPYQLASTTCTFWPGLADGSLVGEGGLFDGALQLVTPELTIDVPRYYEADRFSGPFGPDRGISPFAVDFRFGAGEVGALFFDPARRYAELLSVPEPWSTEYVEFPY